VAEKQHQARRGIATVGATSSTDRVLEQIAHLAAIALDFDQAHILIEQSR
jgi:hypothetical protein